MSRIKCNCPQLSLDEIDVKYCIFCKSTMNIKDLLGGYPHKCKCNCYEIVFNKHLPESGHFCIKSEMFLYKIMNDVIYILRNDYEEKFSYIKKYSYSHYNNNEQLKMIPIKIPLITSDPSDNYKIISKIDRLLPLV